MSLPRVAAAVVAPALLALGLPAVLPAAAAGAGAPVLPLTLQRTVTTAGDGFAHAGGGSGTGSRLAAAPPEGSTLDAGVVFFSSDSPPVDPAGDASPYRFGDGQTSVTLPDADVTTTTVGRRTIAVAQLPAVFAGRAADTTFTGTIDGGSATRWRLAATYTGGAAQGAVPKRVVLVAGPSALVDGGDTPRAASPQIAAGAARTVRVGGLLDDAVGTGAAPVGVRVDSGATRGSPVAIGAGEFAAVGDSAWQPGATAVDGRFTGGKGAAGIALGYGFSYPQAAQPEFRTSSITDVDGGDLAPGDAVAVSRSVVNTGGAPATGVVLTDTLTDLTGVTDVRVDGAPPAPDTVTVTASSVTARLGTGAGAASGGTLAAGETVTLSYTARVAAAPSGPTATSSVTVAFGNGAAGPSDLSLGIATPALTLSPASLDFGSRPVNTTSAARTFTLTNHGGTARTVNGVSLSGADAADFALGAGTCTGSLPPRARCTVRVTFRPTATGARTAALDVDTSAGPRSAALAGVGVAGTSSADVQITLSAPEAVAPRGPLTYTVRVVNNGPDTAAGVAATLELLGPGPRFEDDPRPGPGSIPDITWWGASTRAPGGVRFLSGGGPHPSIQRVVWTIGDLAPGRTATFEVDLTAPSGLGRITSTARAVTTTLDPEPDNNVATVAPRVTRDDED
ncbi:choice-of-anchor D domain-containing protein [Streptomyces sp. MI02-7b]|uniref:choice-of-anchor D domain-containing protein n=1 Tax=Streptomyces sp. MI02-7b TaxID=462941 RepID=UPI0029A91C6E|nr:choice-of-anchor D domain-containing protein [Streptomyces sp. MI02-7b]MDX3076758.1 choice-of-anchor D domain-containing protein [Streptomyces sp. MI02-7b]